MKLFKTKTQSPSPSPSSTLFANTLIASGLTSGYSQIKFHTNAPSFNFVEISCNNGIRFTYDYIGSTFISIYLDTMDTSTNNSSPIFHLKDSKVLESTLHDRINNTILSHIFSSYLL